MSNWENENGGKDGGNKCVPMNGWMEKGFSLCKVARERWGNFEIPSFSRGGKKTENISLGQ
jgi:hypothetical protein